MKGVKFIFSSVIAAVSAAAMTLSLTSCGMINEGLDPCPEPVARLRFVYEYNMEYANAFHNQVHCLSLLVFDESGKLVARRNETSRQLLGDESYRMDISLPEGKYHAVAYGGMECENSSFFHSSDPSEASDISEIRVSLSQECLDNDSKRLLHNHFYGATDFTISSAISTETKVEMMRNTNSIQVALQNAYGSPISHEDFEFYITDDNTLFDKDNNLIENGVVEYRPYLTETRRSESATETKTGSGSETSIALAHFSTSRIVRDKATPTLLRVCRKRDGAEIFRIPLSSYMLLFKENHGETAAMGDQEYLDRENSWRFVFFLDDSNGETWLSTQLIINDWLVRINNTGF